MLFQIAVERRKLTQRLDEREALELLLSQFAAEVKTRVGDLKEEIRTLRAKLEEMRHLLTRLKENPDIAPAEVEREYAELIDDVIDESNAYGFNARAERPPTRQLPARPSASVETTREVMRLYRILAKRYHPDLARSPAERDRRTELMLRINVAYRDHDLPTLQTILLETQHEGPVSTSDFVRQRLAWAQHELARIKRELLATEYRIRVLSESEGYQLWETQQNTGTALDELEKRTRERLQRERVRVEDASAQYVRMSARRQVTLRRAAERVSTGEPVGTPGSD